MPNQENTLAMFYSLNIGTVHYVMCAPHRPRTLRPSSLLRA
jgi:hypothetical protein